MSAKPDMNGVELSLDRQMLTVDGYLNFKNCQIVVPVGFGIAHISGKQSILCHKPNTRNCLSV